MCHDYDFELLRRAYLEELQRRTREKGEPRRKPGSATPVKPATPEPAVRDREPVPA